MSFLLPLGSIAVGSIGAYAIHHLNTSLQGSVSSALERIAASDHARIKVMEMARARAELLAAGNKNQVRAAALSAIRASSSLDESLQQLDATLSESPDVKSLIALYEKLRPLQMKLVGAVKSGKQEKAAGLVDQIAEIDGGFNQLSSKIAETEQQRLTDTMQAEDNRSREIIYLLAGTVVFSVLIGIVISIVSARRLTEPLHRIRYAVQQLADGNLTTEVACHGTDEVEQAAGTLSSTIQSLHQVVSNILNESDTLHGQAGNISTASDQLSEIHKDLNNAVSSLKSETSVVSESAESSFRSAGEAGRGFAVVADEVRQLATHTDSATDNISQLIESIASDTRLTVESLDRTTQTAQKNISDLQQIAGDSSQNSQQAEQMKASMESMVQQLDAQQQAITVIQSSTAALAGITGTTDEQTPPPGNDRPAAGDPALALSRGLAHRGGHAPFDPGGYRRVWQGTTPTKWCATANRRTLEIRL